MAKKITSDMLVLNNIPQDAIDTTFEEAEKAFGKEFNFCLAYIHKRVECEDIIDTEKCRIYRPIDPRTLFDVCLDFYNTTEQNVKKEAKIIKEIKDEFGNKKYSDIRILKNINF